MTRQEAIERINARQNAANIFTNIGEEEIKKEMGVEIRYSVSWSPRDGEATFTRVFDDAADRDRLAASVAITAKSVRQWQYEIIPA